MIVRLASLALAALLLAGGPALAATRDERRQEVRDTAASTLERLYKSQPKAKVAVERSAGYAVFSNVGVKIFVAGGGQGSGVVVDRGSRKETFMKMVEVQAGLGIGVKKFRLVWVFENRSDLQKFVNSGWELGAQATASAQMSGQGAEIFAGAMSVSPGVWLYQLTDDGLAAELTVKGTRYYVDSELN